MDFPNYYDIFFKYFVPTLAHARHQWDCNKNDHVNRTWISHQ